ncbi:MAG: hypothetical protein L6288_14265 [Desulfarculaceae bacterium]|nr:hypothetical protein [Desulfarculaceae bacterium]
MNKLKGDHAEQHTIANGEKVILLDGAADEGGKGPGIKTQGVDPFGFQAQIAGERPFVCLRQCENETPVGQLAGGEGAVETGLDHFPPLGGRPVKIDFVQVDVVGGHQPGGLCGRAALWRDCAEAQPIDVQVAGGDIQGRPAQGLETPAPRLCADLFDGELAFRGIQYFEVGGQVVAGPPSQLHHWAVLTRPRIPNGSQQAHQANNKDF